MARPASSPSAPGSFVSPLSDTPSGLSVGAALGQLVGADFSQARLSGTELHGSDLDQLVGVAALRDVVIDQLQRAPIADALFEANGIIVSNEPTSSPG